MALDSSTGGEEEKKTDQKSPDENDEDDHIWGAFQDYSGRTDMALNSFLVFRSRSRFSFRERIVRTCRARCGRSVAAAATYDTAQRRNRAKSVRERDEEAMVCTLLAMLGAEVRREVKRVSKWEGRR